MCLATVSFITILELLNGRSKTNGNIVGSQFRAVTFTSKFAKIVIIFLLFIPTIVMFLLNNFFNFTGEVL
ncbi:hypothetical protein A6B44_04870 [Pasteurella skyensis]|nr:hypothetical protein A6B44_04870 [Pasteurella skyensis]